MTAAANRSDSPRARDLGLDFPGTPGRHNALTDVPGVLVGYTTLVAGDGTLVVGEGPARTSPVSSGCSIPIARISTRTICGRCR